MKVLLLLDKLGKFIYCNKVFSNLIGIDQNEIISNNFMDLFSDKVVKIFFKRMKLMMK